MELSDYLSTLWRRRWIIVLAVAVGAGSALGVSYQMPPTFEAKSKVFIGPRSVEEGDAVGAIEESTYSHQFVASYAEVLKSRPLAEKVVQKLNLPMTGATLAGSVETRVVPETRLIEVTVSHPSAEQAQLLSNEIATTFVEDAGSEVGGPGAQPVSVFELALTPTSPVGPQPVRNSVVGGLFGVMLGVGAAFMMERLDTALRSKHDVERALTPLPVIGQIPLAAKRLSKVAVQDGPDSPQAEAFRMLRTNVQFFSVDPPVKTVLVTSPFAGEGKTTVATNLAAGMAAVGSKVLLVETDLRKPVLQNLFKLDDSALGLSNVLAGQVELDQAVQKSSIPNLYVLTAGSLPSNPSELLGSKKMVKVINESESFADVVIFDTTPALPVTDAAVLAPHMDAVLLVVRAGQTPANKAVDMVNNFRRHEVGIMGVVLNGLGHGSADSDYYSYRHYRQTRRRWPRRGAKQDEFSPAPGGPASRPSPAQTPKTTGVPDPTPSAPGNGDRPEASALAGPTEHIDHIQAEAGAL